MTNQLVAEAAASPGRLHNQPPLAETLDEDLAPFLARQAQLLDIARTAVILDDDSAAKVTDLTALMRAFEKEIDDARDRTGRPYLEAKRLIDARFGSVMRPVVIARQGDNGKGGLRGMLTAYDDKREREAAIERQRLREEQRQREEEAAAARRAAEEKAAEGKGSVAAELEALKAEDEAERLAQRAEAIRPEPIRSHLGQVTRRRDIAFEIEDPRKLLGWMLKQPGLSGNLLQALRTIVGSYLRSIGVDAVDRGVEIPGLKASVELGAANVRR